MQLTYRGQAYEISTPIQLGADAHSTAHAPIKLIYRGHTYYATPRPTDVHPHRATGSTVTGSTVTGSTVTLTYRGITYQRVLPNRRPYHPAQAMNWRYQFKP